MTTKTLSLFDPSLVTPALVDALRKLDPRIQLRNPVMFVVYVGSIFTTALWLQALTGQGEAPTWFIGVTTLWLWFTVLFANFAEALAEGRSKAQAAALRGAKKTVHRAASCANRATAPPWTWCPAASCDAAMWCSWRPAR